MSEENAMCSRCGIKAGKNRVWDKMLVGYLCDECFEAWKVNRGVSSTVSTSTTNVGAPNLNFLHAIPPTPTITKSLNNKYIISIEHPLIRPGLKITTESSERYVVRIVGKMMEIAREINQ